MNGSAAGASSASRAGALAAASLPGMGAAPAAGLAGESGAAGWYWEDRGAAGGTGVAGALGVADAAAPGGPEGDRVLRCTPRANAAVVGSLAGGRGAAFFAVVRGVVGRGGQAWSGVVEDEALARLTTAGARPGASTWYIAARDRRQALEIVDSETSPAQVRVHGALGVPPGLGDVVVYTDGSAIRVSGLTRRDYARLPPHRQALFAKNCVRLAHPLPPAPDLSARRAVQARGARPAGKRGEGRGSRGGDGGRADAVADSALDGGGDGSPCSETVQPRQTGVLACPEKEPAFLYCHRQFSLAGYGVWFGPQSPFNVAAEVEDGYQSANRAEIRGLLEALTIVGKSMKWAQRVVVRMDADLSNARYVAASAEKDGKLAERDLWLRIHAALKVLDERNVEVTFEWVKGHAVSFGNHCADYLAKQGSLQHAYLFRPRQYRYKVPRACNFRMHRDRVRVQGAGVGRWDALARSVQDRGVQDRGMQDRGVQDRGVQDRGVQDRGVPDRGVPDRRGRDRGVQAGKITKRRRQINGYVSALTRSWKLRTESLISDRHRGRESEPDSNVCHLDTNHEQATACAQRFPLAVIDLCDDEDSGSDCNLRPDADINASIGTTRNRENEVDVTPGDVRGPAIQDTVGSAASPTKGVQPTLGTFANSRPEVASPELGRNVCANADRPSAIQSEACEHNEISGGSGIELQVEATGAPGAVNLNDSRIDLERNSAPGLSVEEQQSSGVRTPGSGSHAEGDVGGWAERESAEPGGHRYEQQSSGQPRGDVDHWTSWWQGGYETYSATPQASVPCLVANSDAYWDDRSANGYGVHTPSSHVDSGMLSGEGVRDGPNSGLSGPAVRGAAMAGCPIAVVDLVSDDDGANRDGGLEDIGDGDNEGTQDADKMVNQFNGDHAVSAAYDEQRNGCQDALLDPSCVPEVNDVHADNIMNGVGGDCVKRSDGSAYNRNNADYGGSSEIINLD